MPFLTYKQTRPFAAAIKEQVQLGKMPPWGADPKHGKFANDRSLSAEERKVLVDWAAAKAPEGDPKDAPKPIEFVSGWGIQKPDLVVSMPKPTCCALECSQCSSPSQSTLSK